MAEKHKKTKRISQLLVNFLDNFLVNFGQIISQLKS